MTYDEMLEYADNEGAIVKEKNIPGFDGRIKHNRIAIHSDISTQIEKSCILAEELGHYHTNYGNVLDQSDVQNRKQELRARRWGYDLKIGLTGIVNAYRNGCRNLSEAAEFLDVTEEYFLEAIKAYRSKYGVFAAVDNYVVYFEPSLAVMKLY